jgi:predicted house-cleaning noncanonical NTP pyrophosphatase (MazG superfamily)
MGQKSYVEALMENEETKLFVENNQELINEAVAATYDYGKTLKNFVLENIEEFIGQNLEETYKNIRLFSEVATMTFVNEAIHAQAALAVDKEQLEESGGINEYL